jgi:hypothetical protein
LRIRIRSGFNDFVDLESGSWIQNPDLDPGDKKNEEKMQFSTFLANIIKVVFSRVVDPH